MKRATDRGPEKLRFNSVIDAGFIDASTIWMLQNNSNGGDTYNFWVVRDGQHVGFNLSDVAWTLSGKEIDSYQVNIRLPSDKFMVTATADELQLQVHTNEGIPSRMAMGSQPSQPSRVGPTVSRSRS